MWLGLSKKRRQLGKKVFDLEKENPIFFLRKLIGEDNTHHFRQPEFNTRVGSIFFVSFDQKCFTVACARG
jgi:hypothetical protein